MPSKKSSAPVPPHGRRFGFWPRLALILVAAILAVTFWRREDRTAAPAASAPGLIPPVVALADFSGYAGSQSCRACHAEAFEQWEKSHHGLAERTPNKALDETAFLPARELPHGKPPAKVEAKDSQYFLTTDGPKGARATFPIARVIGHDPLRQFLVEQPGGRLQTLELAYDPKRGDWFDIFGQENRTAGEWGHWTGRGMTWNAMCATCHNTRLHKNYDPATDTYRTAMAEATVSCEACHGPMKAHVDWWKQHPTSKEPDPTLRPLSRDAMLDTCGHCHSRRREISGDFVPGDHFADHHQLTTVDASDLYYADGQVRDELYEYGSFVSSKMHGAGVRCVDCHQPHSAKTILPGDALCLRCHSPGAQPQTVRGQPLALSVLPPPIDANHSHHGPGVASCVSCHMPVTTYMQRHPRHDHSFSIPDPLLKKELGIPSACDRCHTDKDAAWATEAADKWWGPKMERPSRQRARLVAAARRAEPGTRGPLIEFLQKEPSAYWKASLLRLLAPWAGDADTINALLQYAQHPDALVRTAAVQGLEPLIEAGHDPARQTIQRKLSDPARAVRVAAAWALRETVEASSPAGRELLTTLAHGADQPGGQIQLAHYALAKGDTGTALTHAMKAAEWDPHSADLRREIAVLLSSQGKTTEALAQMKEAVRLAPQDADLQHLLGLAWNEAGATREAVEAFQRATQLDPKLARAWYNLGLARNQLGDATGAISALHQGEIADPRDARIPFARATIHARRQEWDEARAAAQRARERGSAEAAALLRQLPPPGSE